MAPVAFHSDEVDGTAGPRSPVCILFDVKEYRVPMHHQSVKQCSQFGLSGRARGYVGNVGVSSR
eukprot:9079529-Lingulodinium_polyedra.AAC.1